jgi:hypothetical protein
MAQRIYQIACGDEDANDANHLRTDAMFKLGVGRKPLDDNNSLASAPTFSRQENATTARQSLPYGQSFSGAVW